MISLYLRGQKGCVKDTVIEGVDDKHHIHVVRCGGLNEQVEGTFH